MFTVFAILFSTAMAATNPVNSLQMQQLIKQSEQQLEALRQLIEQSRRDTQAKEEALRILKDMTLGLNKAIEPFKGTDVYEAALLEIQTKDDFKRLSQQGSGQLNEREREQLRAEFRRFQKQSLLASQSDLKRQSDLQTALLGAPPGFVPKLQAQIHLGEWKTATRLSMQLTEMMSTLESLSQNSPAKGADALSLLIRGAELQNEKQRQGQLNGKR